jgi:hypothetical protein
MRGGTYGAEETYMLDLGENVKQSGRFKDLSVDVRIILKKKTISQHSD